MICYTDSIEKIDPSMLAGFFEGWVSPLSKEEHFKVLENSYAVVLAVDEASGRVVGCVNAISDGIFAAHIQLFEVVRECRNRGIGTELFKRMLGKLKGLYGISLMCDEDVQPFYARFGMSPGTGMNIRNYRWRAHKA